MKNIQVGGQGLHPGKPTAILLQLSSLCPGLNGRLFPIMEMVVKGGKVIALWQEGFSYCLGTVRKAKNRTRGFI